MNQQEKFPVNRVDLDAWGLHSFLKKSIRFTTPAELPEIDTCHIWPYAIQGERESDGAFFILPPHTKTAVAQMQFAEVEIDIVDGQGICISAEQHPNAGRFNSDRFVVLQRVERHNHLFFDGNDTYCLITGKKGLIAQVKTTPAYQPNETEELLPENDPRVLKDFWLAWSLPYNLLYMAAETPPGP